METFYKMYIRLKNETKKKLELQMINNYYEYVETWGIIDKSLDLIQYFDNTKRLFDTIWTRIFPIIIKST